MSRVSVALSFLNPQFAHNRRTAFDINMGVAEVQAVAIDLQGRVTAASDSRKNGIAAAY